MKLSLLMDAEEEPDHVGELEGFHLGWTPKELLFQFDGLDMISSIPERWKPWKNVLTHHKGKIPDTQSLCTSLQNLSKSFKLCYDSWGQSLKTYPQDASSFYAVITHWCHGPKLGGDYLDGRRDDQRVSQRKMWIPQTNHRKDDEKFGRTIISFFSQWSFVSSPHSSIVNSPCLYYLE